MQMYSEADVDTSYLDGKQVTILGYGSQGRAHALNLKDSGFDVVVGLRPEGGSWARAEADGLTVKSPNEAVQGATVVAFLTPDMVQKQLYASVVDDIITTGATMNELSRVLKRRGARRVTAMAVARATRSDVVIRKAR